MEWNKKAEIGYAALCKKYGIAEDVFDVKAYWDSTLEYHENLEAIEEELKKISPEAPVEMSAKQISDETKRFEQEEFVRGQREKQQYLEELFNGVKQRDGEANELLEEIRKFNPNCEKLTLSTLMAINQGVNVINLSPAGYGKSRATKELLDLLEIPYTEISGHKAPTDFYEAMKNSKGLVLIDESATLLKNNEILNLLLSALWTKKIAWRDDEATVEANIIFNTNSLPNTPFMAALKDRCQFNQLRLGSEKIKEKLLSDFDYFPNKLIWTKIKNNVFYKTDLTPEEVDKIKETIKLINPKSVRDKKKLLSQAKFAKSLFGSIDYMKLFLEVDAVAEIMASDLKRAEKIKAIAQAENITVRTARRWVSDEEVS